MRLLFLFLLLSGFAFAQTGTQSQSDVDTTKSPFSFKNAPWYGRSTPFGIYTGAGKLADRAIQSIEIGKTFNVIDIGIAGGRSTFRPDTTFFLEGRVTMDVGNYGPFASEMTIGAGKLFDKPGSLMLELSYSIFAQIAKKFGFGLITGYYDFSNEFTDSSKAYYGVYLRYGLERTDTGGLLGLARPHPRLRSRHVHR